MCLASRNVKPTAGDGLERQRDADGITDEPWVWNPRGVKLAAHMFDSLPIRRVRQFCHTPGQALGNFATPRP
jgi:hypothetical protein